MIDRLNWLTIEDMKNKQLRNILIVLTIFVFGFYSGANFEENKSNPSGYEPESIDLDMSQYWEVWDRIQTRYIGANDIDEKEAVRGSIRGLVESLEDPYSAYLDPSDTEIFTSDLDNELDGIGAELTVQDSALLVVQPLKGSPAEKAGLKIDDIILKVDGQDSGEMTFMEAIQKIRGKKGTKVTLDIYRDSTGENFPLTITRGHIEVPSLTTEELEDGIFYMSINQFSNDTEKEFYEGVREALLFNAKGMILDLRSNGGGYLDASVDILGEFIESGQVAVIIESQATRTRELIKTDGSARLKDIPLVVLINGDSASASEILAGALQDLDRATIIGETSFGKGTVQEVQQLSDKSSLRLTIARWLTPNETNVDGKGVAPDLVVAPLPTDGSELEEGQDLQLDKAKEYLLNLK